MNEKQCAVCGVDGLHQCSVCKSIRYCSKDHQKQHWKVHKLTCRAWKEECDDKFGKHLVASRDLKPGEFILKEKPCLVRPPNYEGGPAVCVGCFLKLDGKGKNCPSCQWPMCGQEKCWGEGSQHKLGECSALKAACDHVAAFYYCQGRITTGVHLMIMVLRALALRQRDPIRFGMLMDFKFRGPNRPCLRMPEVFFQLEKKWIPKEWAVPENVITRICCIFHANSFNLDSILEEVPKGPQVMYFVSNMIEHACLPNATYSFNKDGEMVIRTTVPIKKGAKILLNQKIGVLSGTIKRQNELKDTRFYSCDCQRCQDPTELGTFVSGIYCRKCPDQEGIILSESPLDEHAEWVCNKCADRHSPDSIGLVFNGAADEFEALNRQSITEMEGFLNKFAKILHPNFFCMMNVKIALCALYNLIEPDNEIEASYAKDVALRKKEELTREYVKLLDVVSPGKSRLRGSALYGLFGVMQSRNIRVPRGNMTPDQVYHSYYQDAHKLLSEVVDIYSLEPEGTIEASLLPRAKEDLEDIRNFIRLYQLNSRMW